MGNISTNYVPLSRPDAFMAIAALFAARSKDPVTQVGAVIVDKDEHIAATGYNGFPAKIDDDLFPWHKEGDIHHEKKYLYVAHAERNALRQNTRPFFDGTLYVTIKPCHDCATYIAQNQQKPKEIKFLSLYKNGLDSNDIADVILEPLNISIKQHLSVQHKINLDFKIFGDGIRLEEKRLNPTKKRTNYLPWDEAFMGAARIMSLCSKNYVYQQGAVLVDSKNRTLGFGYNGLPRHMSSGNFDWSDVKKRTEHEISGALNCMINSQLAKNSTLYTTHFPDHHATHDILFADVKKVVYGYEPDRSSSSVIASERMLKAGGVEIVKFKRAIDKIDINLRNGNIEHSGINFKE